MMTLFTVSIFLLGMGTGGMLAKELAVYLAIHDACPTCRRAKERQTP